MFQRLVSDCFICATITIVMNFLGGKQGHGGEAKGGRQNMRLRSGEQITSPGLVRWVADAEEKGVEWKKKKGKQCIGFDTVVIKTPKF